MALGLFIPRYAGRVLHPPMPENRLTWEDGTRFLGAVAHRDHDVPGFIPEIVHSTGLTAPPIDSGLAERFHCVGIDSGSRLGACALSDQTPASFAVQHRFGHLAACRVPGANDQYAQRTVR